MARKQTPSFSADDFINNIAANASNIAAAEAARNRETPTADPGRVGEPAPASPVISPSSPESPAISPAGPKEEPPTPAESEPPASPMPPAKTIISFVPYDMDAKLAVMSSQNRISKKRIVLEALIDYIYNKGMANEEEKQQWINLPKEFGTVTKGK